jgi:hypothetical protein
MHDLDDQSSTASAHDDAAAPATSNVGEARPRTVWLLVLTASLAAGAAAWYLGEKTQNYFKPSEAASKNIQDPGPLRRELATIMPRNSAISYGILGALIGLGLGLAGGLARGSPASALVVAGPAAVVGAAAGAGLSFALVPFHLAGFDPTNPSLMLSLFIRSGIGAAIGASAGLIFAIALAAPRRAARIALGGLMGGLVAAFAFEVLMPFIDPLDRNDQAVPTTPLARFLALMSSALLIGIGVVLAARRGEPIVRRTEGSSS